MATVGINPPKAPVTKAAKSIAAATVPNVCKMPGPPAPFVPTPLPNIAMSNRSPKGYSKSVKIEKSVVAIRGASHKSVGDIASKATGGGIVSANTEGPATFIAPGSLNVRIEGKNVQLLGDQMLNNNGPAGSPPNAATLMGTIHPPVVPTVVFDKKEFPGKVQNIKKALGKKKKMKLNRETDRKVKRANRRAALKGKRKAGKGKSWDEFPFASSKQGGKNARVRAISRKEQCKQGGKLSAFYRNNNVKDGSPFWVQIS